MSIADKIKVLSDLEKMFQKRSYHIVVYDEDIHLDEYSYETTMMDFNHIQFFLVINKDLIGYNQIYNFDSNFPETSENFGYFRDIDVNDISYFLLSAKENVVKFLRKVDLDILIKIKELVRNDLNRITLKEITSFI